MEKLIVRAFAIIQLFLFIMVCFYLESIFNVVSTADFMARTLAAIILLGALGHTRYQLAQKLEDEEKKLASVLQEFDTLGRIMAKGKGQPTPTITDAIFVDEVVEKGANR
jgi:hypothetical protein